MARVQVCVFASHPLAKAQNARLLARERSLQLMHDREALLQFGNTRTQNKRRFISCPDFVTKLRYRDSTAEKLLLCLHGREPRHLRVGLGKVRADPHEAWFPSARFDPFICLSEKTGQ